MQAAGRRAAAAASATRLSPSPLAAFAQRPTLLLRQRCPAAAGSTLAASQAPLKRRLYLLDMLPLVYKVLPPEAFAQQQQQQQQHAAGGGGPAPSRRQQQQPAADAAAAAAAALSSVTAVPPSQAIMSLLLELVRRRADPPTHMAVVVDAPGPSFRRARWPGYKAQRPPPPPGLPEELARVLALVDAAGVPVLSVPGVEADDVIGSLALRAARDGFDVVVVSPDRDFYQLLRPGVSVLASPRPRDAPPRTAADFCAEQGLSDAALWADVKALAGDAADNVPGVRGVGPKTALALVRSFGGVDDVLAALRAPPPPPPPPLAAGGEEQPEQALPPAAQRRRRGGSTTTSNSSSTAPSANDDAVQRALAAAAAAGVKLNRSQAEALCSAEGAAAARFAKELVTIAAGLRVPPVWAPWEHFELRVPADGGRLATQRALALQLPFVAARLTELFAEWAAEGGRGPGPAAAAAAAAAQRAAEDAAAQASGSGSGKNNSGGGESVVVATAAAL